ncbi:MAG: hypothetical protein DRO93_08065 [Candidatus Thorarchaeota archaeon]|nr:MAG: hypothetical protein DRO93_08065 [Candidatus Thorarchaeota archaeon]
MKQGRHLLTLSMIVLLSILVLAVPEAVIGDVSANGKASPNTMNSPSTERTPGPLLLNTVQNPSFETVDGRGVPTDFSYYGSGDVRYNFSSASSASAGSYGAMLEVASTEALAETGYISADIDNAALEEILDFSFDWRLATWPADGDFAYVLAFVQTTNSSSSDMNLYYILWMQESTSFTNSTTHCYFIRNDTAGAWHSFSTNVTSDFLSTGLSLDPSRVVTMARFEAYMPAGYTDPAQLDIDEVSLSNTSHEYIPDGTFETAVTQWDGFSRCAGHVSTSGFATEGDRSLNITTARTHDDGESFAYATQYLYSGPPVYAPGKVILSLDWRVSRGTVHDEDNYAYVRLYLQNATRIVTVTFYLVAPSVSSNYSSSVSIRVKDFNSTDTWHHLSVDLYDVLAECELDNLTAYSIRLYCGTYGTLGSRTVLLVDSFSILAAPARNPGFEAAWRTGPSDVGSGWNSGGDPGSSVSLSGDAHSGKHSLNLTASDDAAAWATRPVYARMAKGIEMRFSYRNRRIEGTGVAYLQLAFEGGYLLYYFFARNVTYSALNSSTTRSYVLPDCNVTGSWRTVVRNISRDLSNFTPPFGHDQWNLTYIRCHLYSESGSNFTVLLDDIDFYDVVPPTVSHKSRTPASPTYYEPATVAAQATDNLAGVYAVSIVYRVNGGTWSQVVMTPGGSDYVGQIPACPFGGTVEYYLVATDLCGVNGTDDNGGAYYSYVVGDDIVPEVSILTPANKTSVSGIETVSVEATDVGSGIAFVTLYLDDTLVGNLTASPYTFSWDTRLHTDGVHTLKAVAHDNGGNSAEDSVVVEIQNGEPLILSGLAITPNEPEYDDAVRVAVYAQATGGIENVTLHYRIGSGAWMSTAMSASGDKFVATIPPAVYGTVVSYYVIAYDTTGLAAQLGNESSPYAYTVGDKTPPTISFAFDINIERHNGMVYFTVNASDAGSGLESIKVYVDDTLIATLGPTETEYLWDPSTVPPGAHNVTFVAVDLAGNSASASVTIKTGGGLGGLGEAFAAVLSTYGIAIGFGAAIAGYIVLRIVIAQRRGK